VEGPIHRILASSALTQDLAAAAPREQAAAYARHGIWFDALTQLGRLYEAEPENPILAADWSTFLDALEINLPFIGFSTEDVIARPIIDCCSPIEEPFR